MNTEKVFIGYTIDNEEILLFKKDDGSYVDLISKDNPIVPSDKIDLSSLVPYSKIIKCYKYKTKKGIIKKYKLDRSKMINVSNIKMGSVCLVDNVKVEYVGIGVYAYSGRENVLYYSLFQPTLDGRYKDFLDGRKYEDKDNISDIFKQKIYSYIITSNATKELELLKKEIGSFSTKKEVAKVARELKKTSEKLIWGIK